MSFPTKPTPKPRRRANLSTLNPAQLEAVRQIHGPVLILAGAGTGKTRVVTTRISHMIDEGIAPSRILAVTFTNKAANEMRERVGGMVSKAAAGELTVSTFHSLCVRILRTSIDRLGYKKNFSIYTGSDQVGLVRKLIAQKAGKDEKLDPQLALSLIGRQKSRGIPVSDNANALICEIFKGYQAELKLLNAVDFDDLLILAVKLLAEFPEVREQWQARFGYMMVDEFQDTNSQQMALVQNLVNAEHNVCVVGDDDQSIYGWRGAEISNILDFERFFPNPRIIKLEENYRSTNPILHTANSLIVHNANRREKRLWSRKEGTDPVRLVLMPDDREEARVIVEEIVEIHNTEKRDWNDFALLIRMNAQSRIFEGHLREAKVPYRVIGGMSFYDRREIKDLLGYLQLLCNPDDDVNLLRVVNNPPRGIGAGTITQATDYSRQWEKSIYETLRDEDFTGGLSARAREALAEFTEVIERYRDAMCGPSAPYPMAFQKLIDEIEFIEFTKRSCKTAEEGASREQNIRDLIESLHHHHGKAKEKRRTLQDFLDGAALQQDREGDDDFEKQQGVSLITLHAAKGLEYPVVYLVGIEEGVLPHKRSIEEGTRDEERRLLYVGITRAQERLTITYCNSRIRYGEEAPCQPSSFLKELDRDHLEEVTHEDLSMAPAEEEVALGYFARMREMLAGD